MSSSQSVAPPELPCPLNELLARRAFPALQTVPGPRPPQHSGYPYSVNYSRSTLNALIGRTVMQNFEPFSFASKGAPGPSRVLARHISDLLVPAVTKAAIDLWIATSNLSTVSYAAAAAPGTSLKSNPYEVTIVQNLFEILVTDGAFGTPVWEAGFKSGAGAGAPAQVDIVLEDAQSTSSAKVALLEFGVSAQGKPSFNGTKINADLGKLGGLQLLGVPVVGFKQVYYVTIASSPQALVYKNFKVKSRAAAPGAYLGARRFPIFSPGGWMYATVAVYE